MRFNALFRHIFMHLWLPIDGVKPSHVMKYWVGWTHLSSWVEFQFWCFLLCSFCPTPVGIVFISNSIGHIHTQMLRCFEKQWAILSHGEQPNCWNCISSSICSCIYSVRRQRFRNKMRCKRSIQGFQCCTRKLRGSQREKREERERGKEIARDIKSKYNPKYAQTL